MTHSSEPGQPSSTYVILGPRLWQQLPRCDLALAKAEGQESQLPGAESGPYAPHTFLGPESKAKDWEHAAATMRLRPSVSITLGHHRDVEMETVTHSTPWEV